MQKIENLSFPEAVRAVAQKCGIPLPKRDFNSPEEAQESRQRGKLLDLHEAATTWFQDQLKFARRRGRARIPHRPRSHRRGDRQIPHRLRAGLLHRAPRPARARQSIPRCFAPPGFSPGKSRKTAAPGTLYARFRKRITFPIVNESGKVIAFTARALDSAATPGEKAGPKYLNSPETPLYSKGQVLFNLDKARAAIRQS